VAQSSLRRLRKLVCVHAFAHPTQMEHFGAVTILG
jgi:hypothetical protein